MAIWVFGCVRKDYRTQGKLTRGIAMIQTGYFVYYVLCSYMFLDSHLSQIKTGGLLFLLACVLMVIGFLVVILTMSLLGSRSFGNKIGKLNTSGLYRYSLNPQMIEGFLFILGYALLWPAWQGFAWAAVWLVISSLMVRGEEEHLTREVEKEYQDYCGRVPRYFDLFRDQ